MNDSLLAASNKITSAVETLIRGICFYSDAVKVEHNNCESNFFQVIIIPDMGDYRLLCGKSGRQINALRFIVYAAAQRAGLPVDVGDRAHQSIVWLRRSYLGNVEEPCRPFKQSETFDRVKLESMIQGFIDVLFDNPGVATIRYEDKENRRLRVLIRTESARETTMIDMLADIFYPYGYRQGQIIELRSDKQQQQDLCRESANDRTRAISGQQ